MRIIINSVEAFTAESPLDRFCDRYYLINFLIESDAMTLSGRLKSTEFDFNNQEAAVKLLLIDELTKTD